MVIERAALPGEAGFFILGRNVAQPKSRQTVINPGEVGTIAILVEAGTLTYEIEQPGGRIIRDASSAAPREESAPVGTPFTLAAGDALIHPAGRRVERNDGETPVRFMWAVILEPIGPPAPDPSDVGEVSSVWLGRYDGPWLALPDGPISLTLERTTVHPRDLVPRVTGGMQAVAQESGTPGELLVGGDGTAVNLGEEPIDALVLRLVPAVATVSLLAEAMPAHPAVFDAWVNTFAPGDRFEVPADAAPASIAADLVVDGAYAAQSAGRMQLQRGGIVEEVAPGTEVRLGVGDAVVYVENTAAQVVHNPGATESRTVSFGVFSIAPPAAEYAGAVNKDAWERSGFATEDVTVTVERLTLPPGATLSVDSSIGTPRVFVIGAGTLEWVLSHTGGQAVLGFIPGQVIPFYETGAGERLELRNPGEQPLEVFQLTLRPDEPGAAAATPAP